MVSIVFEYIASRTVVVYDANIGVFFIFFKQNHTYICVYLYVCMYVFPGEYTNLTSCVALEPCTCPLVHHFKGILLCGVPLTVRLCAWIMQISS